MLLPDDPLKLVDVNRIAFELGDDGTVGPVLDKPPDSQGIGPGTNKVPETDALHLPKEAQAYPDVCHALAPLGR